MDDSSQQPIDQFECDTECDEPKPHGPVTRGLKNGLLIGTCVAITAGIPLAIRMFGEPSATFGNGQDDISYSAKFLVAFLLIVFVGGCAGAASAAMVKARSDPRPWWRRWLPRFSLRTMLVFQILIATLLAVPYSWPKWEQLRSYVPRSDDNIGYYRGLGWGDEPGYFGKNFYRFRVSAGGGEPIEYVDVDVFLEQGDSSSFRAFYPDGTLRLEGVGSVEFSGFHGNEPIPDFSYPKCQKSYRPDGTLGSEIVDGTGVATIWRPDGRVASEWVIENYDFVSWTHYDLDGNVVRHVTP